MSMLEAPLAREASALPSRPAASPLIAMLRQFGRSPAGVIGAIVLLALILITLLGPTFYSIDPLDLAGAPFTPPGADAWLGTDYLGRDILAGLIYGGRATPPTVSVARPSLPS